MLTQDQTERKGVWVQMVGLASSLIAGGGGIQVDLEGHPRIPTWGSTFPSGTSAGDPIVTRVQNLSPSSLVGTALPGRAEGKGLLEGQVAGNDPVGAAGTTVCAWKQI